MECAIEVRDLAKSYGSLTAVNGISISINEGEVFGLLGPNGAGKTTSLEMIEGLRKPDRGTIRICGLDAAENAAEVKELIGVQLQNTSLYEKLRLEEMLDLFGGYYKSARPSAEVLEEVFLGEKRKSCAGELSGGQRQRVALALALVNDPKIIFLDEPTNSLDPQTRRSVWAIIDGLIARGKTIIMNTHYMEEAEQLCDRVGIIDKGEIIAIGSPEELINEQNTGTASGTAASLEDAFLCLTGKNLRDF